MENLLAVSFVNLSSENYDRIRKGLRQIEGLLAQLCLAESHPAIASQPRSLQPRGTVSPKSLRDLRDDPAFVEFFRLQESFEWNIATRLLQTLDLLLGHPSSIASNLLILSNLTLLQGLLLLHPPSRALFAARLAMTSLLDLLDPHNPPAILSATLLVLSSAILDHPRSARTFEALQGPGSVISLLRTSHLDPQVKGHIDHFLYFYLMPEDAVKSLSRPESRDNDRILSVSAPGTTTAAANAEVVRQEAKALAGAFSRSLSGHNFVGDVQAGITKQTAEKQRELARHIDGVKPFIRNLRAVAPMSLSVV